jgi:hypothetical protein
MSGHKKSRGGMNFGDVRKGTVKQCRYENRNTSTRAGFYVGRGKSQGPEGVAGTE